MKVYKNTVTDTLWSSLTKLMDISEFHSFRLVGGTSLSLLLGHRMSVDIDLFTDAAYGSLDFLTLLRILQREFEYVEASDWSNEGVGNSCFIGNRPDDAVKLDLFYTDPFIFPIIQAENVRLSRLEEISSMKLDVIGRGGRKKDFWDVHKLLEHFSIEEMIELYLVKYPYHHTEAELRQQLINFKSVDHDFDPICLEGKYWELIKLDFEELMA